MGDEANNDIPCLLSFLCNPTDNLIGHRLLLNQRTLAMQTIHPPVAATATCS
jgi:hypothetical protein